MMRLFVVAVVLVLALPVHAQVYRWVDDRGQVNYSSALPQESANASIVGATAKGGFMSPPSNAAYRKSALLDHEPRSVAPVPSAPQSKGLEFRKYISIQRGMTEGELLGIAGEPDLFRRDRSFLTCTYMPTVSDPFTTTITLVRGRVSEIDRVRKF